MCAKHISKFNQQYPDQDLIIYINGHMIRPEQETEDSIAAILFLHPQPNCRVHFSTSQGSFSFKRTAQTLEVDEQQIDVAYMPIQIYTKTLLTRFATRAIMTFKAHEIWSASFYGVKYALPTALEQYLKIHPDHHNIRKLHELILSKNTIELGGLREVWAICENITQDECRTLLKTQTPNEHYLGRLAEVVHFVHVSAAAGLGFQDCLVGVWHFLSSHQGTDMPANTPYLGVNMHNQILSGYYYIETPEGV